LEKLSEQKIILNRWDINVKDIQPKDYKGKKKYVNVYSFLEKLSKFSKKNHIATANGMASVATHQALKIARGQRFITNAGLGNMGSGLPLAIGASIANQKKTVICMEGDGSIMLNIQELQTVVHHHLPLKIFIFNNNGYYSIKVTHMKFFKKIFAANPKTGVSLPDFEKIANAWGIKYFKISRDEELQKLKNVIDHKGPVICELMLDPDQPMLSKWSAGKFKKN